MNKLGGGRITPDTESHKIPHDTNMKTQERLDLLHDSLQPELISTDLHRCSTPPSLHPSLFTDQSVIVHPSKTRSKSNFRNKPFMSVYHHSIISGPTAVATYDWRRDIVLGVSPAAFHLRPELSTSPVSSPHTTPGFPCRSSHHHRFRARNRVGAPAASLSTLWAGLEAAQEGCPYCF